MCFNTSFRLKQARQLNKTYAPVAQLDRVFGYEPKGRGFESLRGHQLEISNHAGSGLRGYFFISITSIT